MPKNWRWIGQRIIQVSGKEYYEVYFPVDGITHVGDIFSNWRESEHYKRKLYTQITGKLA